MRWCDVQSKNALVTVLLLAMMLPWTMVTANDAVATSSHLPSGRDGTSAVWDGAGNAYIIGGRDSSGPLDDIVRYTPATGTVSVVGHLPVATEGATAVWDGSSNIYVFTGLATGQIVRFTPATGTVTTMASVLPDGRGDAGAVWDGAGNAYIFGGTGVSGITTLYFDDIVRYTPATGSITVMPTHFPFPRWGTTAIWDGANAYVFGGLVKQSGLVFRTGEIFRYTPAANTLTRMSAGVASDDNLDAAWDGTQYAYVFGGSDPHDFIYRYAPATDTATVLGAKLSTPVEYVSAVWDPTGTGTAYVFGGEDSSNKYDTILRYTRSAPSAPTDLTATGSPTQDGIILNWTAPADDGGVPIVGYDILRGFASGTETPYATTGDVRTYRDAGCPPTNFCYYKVHARNALGSGPDSNEDSELGTNTHNLLPQSAPGAAPCSTFTKDQDGDGVPSYRVCTATVTVHPNGSTTTTETGFLAAFGDPDDNDPKNPGGRVTDGPYATVERSTGDGVHYKLGAKFTLLGSTFDLVREGTPDAGQLPLSVTAPSGLPISGPDADNDGVPAYVDVPMTTYTIQDNAALSVTTAPAMPQRIPVDNDASPLVPTGTLPVTESVLTGVDEGPDADSDGVPHHVVLHYSDVTVGDANVVSVTAGQDRTLDVDPDDNDANRPVPHNSVPIAVPGASQEIPVGSQSTPNVPPTPVTVPAIDVPGTCADPSCTQPTPITGPIPLLPIPVGPVGTPTVPGVCVPGEPIDLPSPLPDVPRLLCVPETPGQPLLGGTEPGSLGTLPPVVLPPACTVAAALCLPPTTIPGTTVTVPGHGPESTPSVTVSVVWTGFTGSVDPQVGEYGTIGPFTLPPPLPGIQVCPEGCPVPVPADAGGSGSLTVIVAVGSTVYPVTVPIAA